MRAGALRHSVAIQSPYGARDAVGERVTMWTTVATVRASIDPVKAEERFVDAQLKSSVTHRIRIWYGSELDALDTSWRVLFGARVFTIDGVRNIQERNREIELLCTEGLREE